jgi:hypothetical protein
MFMVAHANAVAGEAYLLCLQAHALLEAGLTG